jgi:malonate transporter and related proteins
MSTVRTYFILSLPLFGIVVLGYLIAIGTGWPRRWTDLLSKLVFNIALPGLLFHLMSGVSRLPPVDARLLIAYFGGCLTVFAFGRWVAARLFQLDAVAQSVFALGGVFSNNVLLGLPIAKLTFGASAVPPVALVLVFNAFVLWSLVTICIEWARTGSFTVRSVSHTALRVLTNPIVAAILSGTLVGVLGFELPGPLDAALSLLGNIAAPGALLALGMSLAVYDVRQEWRQSLALCCIKLVVLPLCVWAIAAALDLPSLEAHVVVLLGSMAMGVNVYLVASQFQALQGTMATSLVLSTALAAFTTPLMLALVTHFG